MHPDEYVRMHSLEDHYWWFVGRRTLALGLLRRYVKAQPRILDLGCGTGIISREMGEWADVVSLDMSPIALKFCQGRGLTQLVRADGTALPLAGERADALIGLDIFEHIDDHVKAFQETYRVLEPGGLLVLSVPAFKWLWGPHDVALMHFRRYTKPEVDARLREVGFEIVKSSYSVFFLFPIVAIIRFFEKRKKGEPKASLAPLPGWVNSVLIRIQAAEAWFIHRVNLPWGSSVVVVARKPS
jgi:SAM-dependent methyltransferase